MSTHHIEAGHPIYGLMAEFETPTQLVTAARLTKDSTKNTLGCGCRS